MRFWTRQHEAVWDELQKTDQYIVKKEYIEAKNDTISEFYLNSHARTLGTTINETMQTIGY